MRSREEKERNKLIKETYRAKGRTEGFIAGSVFGGGGMLLSTALSYLLAKISSRRISSEIRANLQQNDQKSLEEKKYLEDNNYD